MSSLKQTLLTVHFVLSRDQKKGTTTYCGLQGFDTTQCEECVTTNVSEEYTASSTLKMDAVCSSDTSVPTINCK